MAQDAKGIAPKHMPVGLGAGRQNPGWLQSLCFSWLLPVSLRILTINSYHIDHLSYCKSLKVFPNSVLIIEFSPVLAVPRERFGPALLWSTVLP